MNKPNHFEHSPSKKDESKNWKWFWEFIATLGVIAIVVIGVSWALVGLAHIPLADLLRGSFFTAFAAVLAAAVIHYRWMQDRAYQEKSEQERLDIEQRRHREQERGKRQEKMGERVAQAVSHLGEGRSYMQVAGLIELAGVVDDWWSLGREMEVDSKTTEVEEVRKLVKRRRQELIDLIFKYTLHLDDQTESVSAASTERQRAKMVQNVRSQLLRDHLSPTSDQSNSDEEYWRHFNLSDAYLSGSDLRNACLKNTKLSGADLRRANLKGANLQGTDLANADLSGANLKGAKLWRANLQGANLEDTNLEDANLQGANLKGAKLEGAKLWRANLQGANLISANLIDAKLWRANLQGANLKGAKLEDANLQDANLINADLSDAKLWLANLINAHLSGAKLWRANLQGANLINADLSDAKLWLANLQDGELWGANLQGADLTDVNLRGADLDSFYSGKPIYNDGTMFPDNYDADQAGFVHDFAPE